MQDGLEEGQRIKGSSRRAASSPSTAHSVQKNTSANISGGRSEIAAQSTRGLFVQAVMVMPHIILQGEKVGRARPESIPSASHSRLSYSTPTQISLSVFSTAPPRICTTTTPQGGASATPGRGQGTKTYRTDCHRIMKPAWLAGACPWAYSMRICGVHPPPGIHKMAEG